MQKKPYYHHAPLDIYKYFNKKILELKKQGIDESKIIIDPGIGFGKNLKHNMMLIRYLPILHSLGVPILVGLSRKSLIPDILDKNKREMADKSYLKPENRFGGSNALEILLYNSGVQIIRTHDTYQLLQSILCLEEVDINLC